MHQYYIWILKNIKYKWDILLLLLSPLYVDTLGRDTIMLEQKLSLPKHWSHIIVFILFIYCRTNITLQNYFKHILQHRHSSSKEICIAPLLLSNLCTVLSVWDCKGYSCAGWFDITLPSSQRCGMLCPSLSSSCSSPSRFLFKYFYWDTFTLLVKPYCKRLHCFEPFTGLYFKEILLYYSSITDPYSVQQ